MSFERRGLGIVRWIVASLGLICALACSAGPAYAEDDSAYRELIEQALKEFQLRNWPEARVLFRRAHELDPSARTLRGMGVVSFEMRDYVQAVQYLSAALEDPRQPLSEAQRSECEGLLTRARTFVGSYAVRVQPEGAQLTLDGAAAVRDQEGRVLVPFGEHVLRASAEDHEEAIARLRVQGGERGDVELTLSPKSPAAPAATTPEPLAQPIPQGDPAEVPAKGPAFEAPARLRGGGLRYTWLSLGLGAAFGGAAVGLWYLGENELDELDSRCAARAQGGDPCTPGDTDTDTVKRYERLTNASIGLAAAAGVTAAVLMAFEWPRKRDVSVNVGLTGVSLRGSF